MDDLTFSTAFLSDVAVAFGRRGKAIRYHGMFELVRAVEWEPPFESIGVQFRSILRLRVDLSVWADRGWNVRVYRKRPGRVGGWSFKHELSGFWNAEASLMVRAFEDSVALELLDSEEVLKRLRGIWNVTGDPPDV